jgi:hypothetical protein
MPVTRYALGGAGARGLRTAHPPFARKILRPGEKRILAQSSADNLDRVGADDVGREVGVSELASQRRSGQSSFVD